MPDIVIMDVCFFCRQSFNTLPYFGCKVCSDTFGMEVISCHSNQNDSIHPIVRLTYTIKNITFQYVYIVSKFSNKNIIYTTIDRKMISTEDQENILTPSVFKEKCDKYAMLA